MKESKSVSKRGWANRKYLTPSPTLGFVYIYDNYLFNYNVIVNYMSFIDVTITNSFEMLKHLNK